MVHSHGDKKKNDEIHMFVHVRWIGLRENLQEIIVNKILCGYLVCLLNQFNDKHIIIYIYVYYIYIIIYICARVKLHEITKYHGYRIPYVMD